MTLQAPNAHLTHDPLALAAQAAGDLTGRDRAVANSLVAACLACAGLVRDLTLIARALPLLPRPRRTRDFHLTPTDASRLRRFAWVPRIRTVLRPLAITMTAAGLAGLALTTVPFTTPAAAEIQVVSPMSGQDEGGTPARTGDERSGILDLGEAPAILIGGGFGLFLLQWGTERAARPSRRR